MGINNTGKFDNIYFPNIKSIMSGLIIDPHKFVSIQPMFQPSGSIFFLDFRYGSRAFYMNEELWLEDDGREGKEYYCPVIMEDSYINDREFIEMLRRELIFDKWEIEQQERYIGGVGNEDKWFS